MNFDSCTDINLMQFLINRATLCTELRLMDVTEEHIEQLKKNYRHLERAKALVKDIYKAVVESEESLV